MRLHRVVLHNFKSFTGTVVCGPFDQKMTVVVGTNGSGKSCLIEGICFALAVGAHQLRASALKSLVNHDEPSGDADVTVEFAGHGELRHLTVQRRIIGGKRSDWRVQECSCECSSHTDETMPWPCACCIFTSMKREALREALKRLLSVDIDTPERFVVHQSTAMAVAQKSPLELLAFLEGVLGTTHLREHVRDEAARSLEMQASVEALEGQLGAERREMARHEKHMAVFVAVEEARAKLLQKKRLHLSRELAFHSARLRKSEAQLAGHRKTLVAAKGTSNEAKARLEAVIKQLRVAAASKAKSKVAVENAERQVARLAEEGARLRLALKQQRGTESTMPVTQTRGWVWIACDVPFIRTIRNPSPPLPHDLYVITCCAPLNIDRISRSIAGLRAELMAICDQERKAHFHESECVAVARTIGARFTTAKAALQEREEAMCTTPRIGCINARGAKRKRRTEVEASSGSGSVAEDCQSECLQLEHELRELLLASDRSGTQVANRLAAERRMRAEREYDRLESQRAGVADRLAEIIAHVAEERRAVEQHERTAATAVHQAEEMHRIASEQSTAVSTAQAKLTRLMEQQASTSANASTGRRIAAIQAIRHPRESSSDCVTTAPGELSPASLASRVHGFLCECLTVDSQYAHAVHAALGASLASTVVVTDKQSAMAVVNTFTRDKVGIVSCLILEELQAPVLTNQRGAQDVVPLQDVMSTSDECFRPLIGRLAQFWRLAPDAATALAALRRRSSSVGGNGCHIVTLQGECFLVSGEIQQAQTRSQTDLFSLTVYAAYSKRPCPRHGA